MMLLRKLQGEWQILPNVNPGELFKVFTTCFSSCNSILHLPFHQTKISIAAGRKKGRSLLMEDGALTWLINNSHTTSASTRRHIELALCHLAQNGKDSNRLSFGQEDIIYEMAKRNLLQIHPNLIDTTQILFLKFIFVSS